MLPVLVIVGRPNVGKSTLFNCLTKSRAALVINEPGVTRDRKYGEGAYGEQTFIVIDTGGLNGEKEDISGSIAKQAEEALKEATVILFVVDAKEGMMPLDEDIANKLRALGKKIILVVNKTDGLEENSAVADFYKVGFELIATAASHRRNINNLLQRALTGVNSQPVPTIKDHGIKIAFIGRPNVGKSTLVNRILGEERVVVYDKPGTTRDSIFIPFQRHGKDYTLIDTAGVRRRGKISARVEKFSVIKALQAIEAANIVVLVIDARQNISEQDLRLLGFIIEAGRGLIIAINKWDGMEKYQKELCKKELDRRLAFIDFAETFYISALHGTGVGKLFPAIQRAYRSATRKLNTPEVTRILEKLVTAHEPPLVRGHRIKLLYAHAGGQNPPLIVIHGRRVKYISKSYRSYLANSFRKILKLVGTPIRIEFKGTSL